MAIATPGDPGGLTLITNSAEVKVIVTPDGREERRFDLVPPVELADLEWVDESRLAMLIGGRSPAIQLDTAEGESPPAFANRGEEWRQTASVGGEIWLLSPLSNIARVLPAGEFERPLGLSYTGSLVALPEPIDVDPALRSIVRPPDSKPPTILRGPASPASPDLGTGEYPSRWLLVLVFVFFATAVAGVLVMITVRRRRAMA